MRQCAACRTSILEGRIFISPQAKQSAGLFFAGRRNLGTVSPQATAVFRGIFHLRLDIFRC